MGRGAGTAEPEWAVLGAHSTVTRTTAPMTDTRVRSAPVWRMVLPLDGTLSVRTRAEPTPRDAHAAVLSPELPHAITCPRGAVAIHLHTWPLGLGPGDGRLICLDRPLSTELISRFEAIRPATLDPTIHGAVAMLREHAVLGPPTPADPRVTAALDGLTGAPSIADLAAEVGLSTSRLRMLVAQHTGTTLQRLRTWLRLRDALEHLPHRSIALAAVQAGFSDQSHMTRAAQRLVGHTPADLAQFILR